jgi:hypothetical protein
MKNISSKKYGVYFEDHWDFYKQPPIRPKIGSFDTYEEAVQCAKDWVKRELDFLIDDPACAFIVPEPEGQHFDSHAYEDELRAARSAKVL